MGREGEVHAVYIATGEPKRGRKRTRSRWGHTVTDYLAPTSSLSQIPKFVPSEMTIEQQEAISIRIRIDEITRKLATSDLDVDYTSDRSPSPEPVYDKDGKRFNTREQRAREKISLERHELVVIASRMSPTFRPPQDYQPIFVKKTRKIPVPVEKYPTYNFIGLIIGPRGNTQKRMEKETGVKISLRGKGSVKEGKGKKYNPSEEEPLHVFLIGDNDIQLEKAATLINDLLVPVDDSKNEHKTRQLQELAKINGTLRGDRTWGFAGADEVSYDPANVKCSICGEASHPAADCPLRGRAAGNFAPKPPAAIDDEYQKFLSEIGEKPAGDKMNDHYKEFLATIKNEKGPGGPEAPVAPWAQGSQRPPAPQAPWQAGGGAADPAAPAPWAQGGHHGAPPPAHGAPAPWQQHQQGYPPQYPPQQYGYPQQGYPPGQYGYY
ncbi:hypothetical protein PROFUN_09938 [Planoprotostelium fungivorum]|uniref:Branchpoint-bridging protein n=1 Tax=Planoprotostelium fungivorum TaxID=1890364 RepID=A0A2P6NG93_9EUKA|nr:hypothetical protein PROFUN_09938 [Planoprotostelium fungivorum]